MVSHCSSLEEVVDESASRVTEERDDKISQVKVLVEWASQCAGALHPPYPQLQALGVSSFQGGDLQIEQRALLEHSFASSRSGCAARAVKSLRIALTSH